ncbi:MAG: S1C family serine protease [Pyrinomonadaceae bacterium]
MKRLIIIIPLLLGLFYSPVFGQKPRSRPTPIPKVTVQNPLTSRQIVDRIMPSVVLVVTQDPQGETIAQGSGFIYKPGLVVTNLHVLKRASSAFVRVVGGKINYKVKGVVGIDIRHDLCILRIDDETIIPLVLSGSAQPSVGDEVFAFGSPKGLEGSVSKGIVSGLRQDVDLMQIDASISPGSSGGPIVNDRAEVVGIAVSSLVGGQNLNFAIPTEFLTKIPARQFKTSDAVLNKIDELIGYSPSVSVSGAGAIAVSDRENRSLKGPVQSCIPTYSPFEYHEKLDKYIEQSSRTTGGKVTFDIYGNLIEEWSYHYGDLSWKYFYSYDEIGFMTSFVWEPASGTDGKREVFQVTPTESILRKMKDVNSIGTFESPNGKWVYDSAGNNIETISKLIKTSSTSVYDRNGLLVDHKYYSDGKFSQGDRYTYEFDQYGNWIKSLNTHFDAKFPSIGYVPRSVRYRKITYFGQ